MSEREIYPCWAVCVEGRTDLPPVAVFGAEYLYEARRFASLMGVKAVFQAASFSVSVNRDKDWIDE